MTENHQQEALDAIAQAETLDGLQAVKTKYVGKSGLVTKELGALGKLPPEERKARGAQINAVRQAIDAALTTREATLKRAALDARLASEAIDVTLPGLPLPAGGLHPINRVYDDLTRIYERLGYAVIEGPEVEDEHHNFEALNVPWYHPARDLQDTFWLEDGRLLRTHTSPMQIRYMVDHEPPLKIVVRGKVYRYEATDATHEAMFHQLEGLVVGDGISMADLKGTIAEMARGLYGPSAKVRFQPSYYPFTEPGADFAVWWENPRGEQMAGAGRLRHGSPQRLQGRGRLARGRGQAARLRGQNRLRFRAGARADRHAQVRHPGHPLLLRQRSARAGAVPGSWGRPPTF